MQSPHHESPVLYNHKKISKESRDIQYSSVTSLLDGLVSGVGISSAIMPLHYKLKDESAPLGELDIRQVDIMMIKT